jgi:hypothetical protein
MCQKTGFIDAYEKELYINDLVEDRAGKQYKLQLINDDTFLVPLTCRNIEESILLKCLKINQKIDGIKRIM